MKNEFLAEEIGIKQGGTPYDLASVVAQDRISLQKGDRLAIIANFGTSTGAVVNLNINQHDAASAGNTKDLAQSNPYFVKAGTATKFTKVVPGADTANYVLSTTFAAAKGTVVFEVLGDDLDANNGFSYVSISAVAATAAKLGSFTYMLNGFAFKPAWSEDL